MEENKPEGESPLIQPESPKILYKKPVFVVLGLIVVLMAVGAVYFFVNDSNKADVIKVVENKAVGLDKSIIFTKNLAEKIQVFELAPYSKNPELLFEVYKVIVNGRKQYPTYPTFQISKNGLISYSMMDDSTSDVYVWKDKYIQKIGRYSDYLISPDGKNIVAVNTVCTDCENFGYEKTKTTYNQKFYKVSTDDTRFTPYLFYEEDSVYNGRVAEDNDIMYVVAGWLGQLGDKILLQKHYGGQLHSTYGNLFELVINSGEIKEVASLEGRVYINSDKNFNNITIASVDSACCGGLNYSNDQTFIYDVVNKVETKIFDEYQTYNNKEKEWLEQHSAGNAIFSPGEEYVAQTIYHLYDKCERCGELYNTPSTLLVTDLFGKEIYKENDMDVVGWIDSKKLLVKSYITYSDDYKFVDNSGGLVIIDLLTKEKTPVLEGDFLDVWIIEK